MDEQMNLAEQYNTADVEGKWYPYWQGKGYFRSTPDEREPYSIVIPPPNVTGVLHMGHMLNNTIQDVLIRKARLEGKNACWVPGTDHASIATEAKVVKMLRERGIKKSDISREEFLRYAFEWKDKYGGIILDQLQKLGASCDWERTRFTMEPKMSDAVLKVFVDLHKKGLLYRGLRMINWDPEALTALSNEEVIYKEEQSQLYHIRYQIEGSEEGLTIATTRPETILADAAIAVHPDDERYQQLKGKRALVPLINRSIPIIFDDYVDQEFGTGALKITPAHDTNDYEIGQRHELEVLDILHDNGRLNPNAQFYVGMDRFEARKQIAKDLKAQGYLVKTENYSNKVGRSERTDAVVEPRLMKQWFVNMKDFSAKALAAVEQGDVRFFPEHMLNMYRNWLAEDKVRDWCVSRQLWWGQRIPAYYYKDAAGEEQVVVALSREAALEQARAQYPDLAEEDLQQDEDVVDTWFSSWLWPISVFDGFENTEELEYYYPTSVLVTGWDIMFFWVARMIMAGIEWVPELLSKEAIEQKGAFPFKDVYFTGMVRDKQGRKMSKSLGNSPDALKLIENYGADGVRYGILSCAAAGNDLIFDAPYNNKLGRAENTSKLCEQGHKFCNKLWQALRLIKGWEIVEQPADEDTAARNAFIFDWLEQRFAQLLEQLKQNFAQYRLSDAVKSLYNFLWTDFCSLYLEAIKPDYQKPIDRQTYERTEALFAQFMTALHPFMPFVSEEIWSKLKADEDAADCVVSSWPEAGSYNETFLAQVDTLKTVLTKMRDIRNKQQLKPKEPLKLWLRRTESAEALMQVPGWKSTIERLGYLEQLAFTEEEPADTVSFIAGSDTFYLYFEKTIDVEAEREKLLKDLEYQEGFLASVEKKLSNQRFVDNAPEAVVAKERKKQEDAQKRIASLRESLKQL